MRRATLCEDPSADALSSDYVSFVSLSAPLLSLQNATELDVDCLADAEGNVVIGGIMEHIEQAGVHSGDSACSLPAQTISAEALATIRDWTTKLARKYVTLYPIHVPGPYCTVRFWCARFFVVVVYQRPIMKAV